LRQGVLSEMREQKMHQRGFLANLVGFSVIHVSQGSVATYVRCGGMSISKFPAESVSERIFQIG